MTLALDKLKFLSDTDKKAVIADLLSEFELLSYSAEQGTSTATEPATKRHKGEHKLLEFIEEFVQSDSVVELSTQQQLETEVSRYMGEEATCTSQSPLE